MEILVLGGTLFLGRAIVDAALAAGHKVTLCNRGKTNPNLYPEIEHLVGDRNRGLEVLQGRSFDAVIDTSGYFPRQIDAVVSAVADIGHYTFVSSCSVYESQADPGADESAAVATVADTSDERRPEDYGGFKGLCETRLDELLPGRSHHVRAGLIVGPHDNTGRFTYWVDRMAKGGRVLVPSPQRLPVQFIDVRDVAGWILHAASVGITGPLNVSGAHGLTMGDLLASLASLTGGGARLEWVDDDFLLAHEVAPWQDMPLWLPMKSHAGFLTRDLSAATSRGLVCRPLAETVEAILAWIVAGAVVPEKDFGNQLRPAGLTPDREAEILRAWDERSAILS